MNGGDGVSGRHRKRHEIHRTSCGVVTFHFMVLAATELIFFGEANTMLFWVSDENSSDNTPTF